MHSKSKPSLPCPDSSTLQAARVMKLPSAVRFNKLPTIGKRGWFGVILVLFGIITVLTAGKSAGFSASQTFQKSDSDHDAELTGLAEGAGYSSYADYLAEQKRMDGVFYSVCGTALITWGYWTCGRRSRDPQ